MNTGDRDRDLLAEIDALTAERDSYMDRHAAAERLWREFSALAERRERERDEAVARIEGLTAECDEAVSNVRAEYDAVVARLRAERDGARARIAELEANLEAERKMHEFEWVDARARIAELEAEVAQMEPIVHRTLLDETWSAMAERRGARVAELEAALEWMASPDNWGSWIDSRGRARTSDESPAIFDRGTRARAALLGMPADDVEAVDRAWAERKR